MFRTNSAHKPTLSIMVRTVETPTCLYWWWDWYQNSKYCPLLLTIKSANHILLVMMSCSEVWNCNKSGHCSNNLSRVHRSQICRFWCIFCWSWSSLGFLQSKDEFLITWSLTKHLKLRWMKHIFSQHFPFACSYVRHHFHLVWGCNYILASTSAGFFIFWAKWMSVRFTVWNMYAVV